MTLHIEAHRFNVELTTLEIDSYHHLIELITTITHQLKEDEHWPDQQKNQAADEMQKWLVANLQGMIEAQNKSEFEVYQKGFLNALQHLPFNGELYSIEHLTLQKSFKILDASLRGITANDIAQLNPQEHKKNIENFLKNSQLLKILQAKLSPVAQQEAEHLKELISDIFNAPNSAAIDAKIAATLQYYKNSTLHKEAIKQQFFEANHEQNLKNSASLAAHQINRLHDLRSGFLAHETKPSKIIKTLGWLGLGIGILIIPLIPPLAPAFIGVGIAGIAYGAIDTSKELVEAISNEHLLGKRSQVAIHNIEEDGNELKTKLKQSFHSSVQHPHNEKVRKCIGIASSSLGVGIGIAVLATLLLPATAFPPALPFVLAAIGIGAAIVAGVNFGISAYREYKRKSAAETKVSQLEATHKKAIPDKRPSIAPQLQASPKPGPSHQETVHSVEKFVEPEVLPLSSLLTDLDIKDEKVPSVKVEPQSDAISPSTTKIEAKLLRIQIGQHRTEKEIKRLNETKAHLHENVKHMDDDVSTAVENASHPGTITPDSQQHESSDTASQASHIKSDAEDTNSWDENAGSEDTGGESEAASGEDSGTAETSNDEGGVDDQAGAPPADVDKNKSSHLNM